MPTPPFPATKSTPEDVNYETGCPGSTTHITSKSSVTKTSITGWVIFLSGSAIWLYGYFIAGHPPIIDWHARTPWWIADFLPNLESELGMLLCIAGLVPMYWPASESK